MTVLYLAPALLVEDTVHNVLPDNVIEIIKSLDQFVVEDLRTARRFLSKIGHPKRIEDLQFRELNEHTSKSDIDLLKSFIKNSDTGVLSEAGAPGIADPGAEIVKLAHENNIRVVPLVGPSSILLALMASGLNGQSFAFAGYLPVKRQERQERIRALERRSATENQTQIFIETPYRNMQLLEDILTCCRLSTNLTIAADITGKNEFIRTQSIKKWKSNKLPELHKIPAVFLLQATKTIAD